MSTNFNRSDVANVKVIPMSNSVLLVLKRIDGMSLFETTHSGGSTVPDLQIGRFAARAARVVLLINPMVYCRPLLCMIAKKASASNPTHFPATVSTKGGFPCKHPTLIGSDCESLRMDSVKIKYADKYVLMTDGFEKGMRPNLFCMMSRRYTLYSSSSKTTGVRTVDGFDENR